jgi:hypothetical protein
LDRREIRSEAIDLKALLWLRLLEEEGKTQRRRTLNEAANAEHEDGGLVSELHALAGSGITKSALVSRMTSPLSTAVTCGTTFLETFSRSAVTQFDRHDCETNIELIASPPGGFIAEWS